MAAPAWESDPARAFAQAREQGKPVFLYWGAAWCPPCNRTRATVFQAPRFADLAARMVLLHLDGDAPAAQALGARFGVRSYPSLVLLRPDASEVTRLPCEVDGPRFLLQLGLALQTPMTAAAALEAALAGTALPDEAWRLLGWYSWDTDEGRLLGGRPLSAVLATLAAQCPLAEVRPRFAWLGAQAALAARAAVDVAATLQSVRALLGDRASVQPHLDLVLNLATDLVRGLTADGSAERAQLAAAWAAALEAVEADLACHLSDRLQALRTRARLARLGGPALDLGLARSRVETARLVTSEPALRHVVVNTGAGVLSDAGLLADAEEVLRAELPRSHAPYYFMHNLAALARKRDDAPAVLSWYEQAWQRAAGPATRLQWGVTYLLALLDLAPGEHAAIEAVAKVLLDQAGALPDAFDQRNGLQLRRAAARLAGVDLPQARALVRAVGAR